MTPPDSSPAARTHTSRWLAAGTLAALLAALLAVAHFAWDEVDEAPDNTPALSPAHPADAAHSPAAPPPSPAAAAAHAADNWTPQPNGGGACDPSAERSAHVAFCWQDVHPLRDALAHQDDAALVHAVDAVIATGGLDAHDLLGLFLDAAQNDEPSRRALLAIERAYRVSMGAVYADLARNARFVQLRDTPHRGRDGLVEFAVGAPRESPFRAALLRALVRAECGGATPGAVARVLAAVPADDRERFAEIFAEGVGDAATAGWIAAQTERRACAEGLALAVAPPVPSPEINRAVDLRVDEYARRPPEQRGYPYDLIVVPGYTPAGLERPRPGVDPVARRRLEQAARDYQQRMAPWVLVSGGNVYPRGTPYFEALEMRQVLVSELGVPSDAVIVEARARHSTTNLRNAGRYMRRHGLQRALVTTVGGGILGSDVFDQDFYFSNPEQSTFYARCASELGYRVGELCDAPYEPATHSTFVPSALVERVNFRDPLDP